MVAPEKRSVLGFDEGPSLSKRGGTSHRLSAEAQLVWKKTALRNALGAQTDRLLDDATEIAVGVGEIIYDVENGEMPPLIIVLKGLVRVFAASPQGRQATIRYITAGDALGLPVLLAPAEVSESAIAVQSLAPTRFIHISGRKFRETLSSNAENMWPLFSELVRSMMQSLHLLSENLFQPVRSRIALHLLDLAERQGDSLVVAASQQDIADAIGSVREVVSRVIISFRNEGLIRRSDNKYIIYDPERLYRIGACYE